MTKVLRFVALGAALLPAAAGAADAPGVSTAGHDLGSPQSIDFLARMTGKPAAVTLAAQWLYLAAGACGAPDGPHPRGVTISWSGACVDKLPDGTGVLTLAYTNGSITVAGPFAHGVAEGQERVTTPAGVFEGEFHRNLPNGPGSYHYRNATSIAGSFHDDVMDGKIHIHFADNTEADLVYKKGLADGPATFAWEPDTRTTLTYADGKPDGAVVTVYADGSRLVYDSVKGTPKPDITFTDAAGQHVTGAYLPSGIDPAQPPHHLDYPEDARRNNEAGTVSVGAVIGGDGRVVRAVVRKSSGYQDLDDAAAQAVGSWTYAPASIGGHPVPVNVLIGIPFKLEDGVPFWKSWFSSGTPSTSSTPNASGAQSSDQPAGGRNTPKN